MPAILFSLNKPASYTRKMLFNQKLSAIMILELVDFGLKVTVAHLVVCVGVTKQENVNHHVHWNRLRLLPL